jgi:plasmid stabilization system protein ParE
MTQSAPRLFVRGAARRDLAEAFRWYEARSTGLGHEFLRAVRVVFAAIQREPERHPVVAEDIRKARVARFPYVVYYVVLDTRISVIAVMHGRRHPRRWQSRR